MEVLINHQTYSLAESSSLEHMLAILNIGEPRGLALAVNDEIVPREQWKTRILKEKDRVTLVRATQGG